MCIHTHIKVLSEYDYMIRSTYKIVPSNTLRLCIDIMNIKPSRPSPTCTKSLVSFYFILLCQLHIPTFSTSGGCVHSIPYIMQK